MLGKYNPPRSKRFDNGLQLISVKNELVLASQLGFMFGARQDLLRCSGTAHVCEHVFCHGASPEAVQSFSRAQLAMHAIAHARQMLVSERQMNRMMRRFLGGSSGPNMNVYTLHGQTGYGHQDLFRPGHLRHVVPVMTGVVRDAMYDVRNMRRRDNAILSPRVFDIERAAVDNETGENDEWPAMEGFRAALKELYTTNPARFWGDSDPEQLSHLQLGTLKQWAQGHYVPGNMCMIVFGPSHNKAIKLVQEVGLDTIPDWPAQKWEYDYSDDVPVLTGVKRVEIRRAGAKMRHVCMLWPTETSTSKDALAIEVLIGLLKDRIDDELRDRNTEYPGGIYHSAVDWERTSTHGYIAVHFSTKGSDVHCDGQIQRVLDVIEGIKNDRSDALVEDVEDGRFYLANAFAEEYRFVPGKFCDRIVFAMANGDEDLRHCNAYYGDMFKVTPTKVRNTAIRYLHRDRHVLSVVRPAL